MKPISHFSPKDFFQEEDLNYLEGKHLILLEGRNNCWYVEAGKVEIFTVALLDGIPFGPRSHYMTRESGQFIFGMEFDLKGIGFGFIADATSQTRLCHLSLSKLQQRIIQSEYSKFFSSILNDWIFELSWNLTKNKMPHPKANVYLTSNRKILLQKNWKIRSHKGVLWALASKGRFLFIDSEELIFGEEVPMFPLTTATWLEAADEIRMEIELTSCQTKFVLSNPKLWEGLNHFHNLVCRCKFLFDRIVGIKERDWYRARDDYSRKVRNTALLDVASVLNDGIRVAFPSDGGSDLTPLFKACQHVGDYLGVSVKSHPDAIKLDTRDRIAAIARVSGFRFRKVTLRSDWYKKDQGPMLATLEKGQQPVALLPAGPTAYNCLNPATGDRNRVDAETAGELGFKAYCFYRPFPDGTLFITDLFKFVTRGLKNDIIYMLLMAISLGLMGMLIPILTEKIFDWVIPQAEYDLLYWFGLALGVAALSSYSFTICRDVAVLRMQGRINYSLQAALWDRLLNLPPSFFRGVSAGELAERVSGISDIRDLLSGTTVSVILGGLTSVLYLVLMFSYNSYLAFAAVGITLIFVGMIFVININRLRYQRKQIKMEEKISGLSFQLIGGISKIRITGTENFAFRRWAADFVRYRKISIAVEKVQNVVAVVMSGFSIITSMTIFGTFWWIQNHSLPGGYITTGDFVAFSIAYVMFQRAMLSISALSADFVRIFPIYERLKPIITTTPEFDEGKSYPGKLSGEIEASHLRFKYEQDGPLVTGDVSFKIRPGEFVAFAGVSGSGKSTLMRLLLGFEIPESGAIYYDGQDLNGLDLREVRQQIGVVLQSSKVFPGTIFENIAGLSSITEEEAWDALRMAGLEEAIREMPMGLYTVVSEDGSSFSAGQRQQMMIARAIVKKSRILLLDEATSALDNETQKHVMQSLQTLQATRIVFAQRLSTIRKANRIFVLEKGKIMEIGNFEELMETDGIFSKLAERQII